MIDQIRSPSRAWASNPPLPHRVGHSALALHEGAVENVAAIYNQAGEDYVAYADGDPTQLFAFDGMHAYADRRVWALLETNWLTCGLPVQARSAFWMRVAAPVPGCAGWSRAPARLGSTASPRAALTSRRRKFNGLDCWPGIYQTFLE